MTLSVAATTVDITPTMPTVLGANGYPNRPCGPSTETLEANALVVHTPEGPIAVVTFDLLYVGPDLDRQLRGRLSPLLSDDRLWLSASHTHRAPAIDRGKPWLGIVDESYLQQVVDHVAEAVEDLVRSPGSRVTLQLGAAHASHSINRRRRGRPRLTGRGFRWSGITMGPNPEGVTDEIVSLAIWQGDSGEPVAVMWHYTCHPTAAPNRLAVNPDYPGVVRTRLREQSDIPVLFFQGFSGNTRPPSANRYRDDPLRRLRLGPHFRDFRQAEYMEWSTSLADVVASTKTHSIDSLPVLWHRHLVPSSGLVNNSPTPMATFQSLRFGSLTMVGTSTEPVVEHGLALRAGDTRIWPVGCLDEVAGYVPTREQLSEGGYEAGDFCRSFGCNGLPFDAPGNFDLEVRDALSAVAGG